MRRPVGPHEPIGAEVRVVRRFPEVAAVLPVRTTARVVCPDPVVDPLPDEAALEPTMPLERGRVVGEPTPVAHRVGVLAKDQRA